VKSIPLCWRAVGVPGWWTSAMARFFLRPTWAGKISPARSAEQSFGPRIFINNEANLAVLANIILARPRLSRSAVCQCRGGLGGIIHDDQLCNGSAGFAGEFGHMTMKCRGELCNCGNRGCWKRRPARRPWFRYIQQAVNEENAPACLRTSRSLTLTT